VCVEGGCLSYPDSSKIIFSCDVTETLRIVSGAGTILGQGGQDQERQSLEREIRFFRSVFLSLKQAFSKKE